MAAVLESVEIGTQPMCEACGQTHRTHAAYTWHAPGIERTTTGHPCLVELYPQFVEDIFAQRDVLRMDQGLVSVESILKDEYPKVLAFIDRLDRDPDALTDEQAGWVRLLRWREVQKFMVPVLFDILGAWMQEKEPEPDQQETGEWMGTEKQRVETRIKVLRINGPFAGEFGDSWLCVMEEVSTGNSCVWWTGDNLAFDEGKEYDIRGTVKKLDVYNGKRQTQLSRVKEVMK